MGKKINNKSIHYIWCRNKRNVILQIKNFSLMTSMFWFETTLKSAALTVHNPASYKFLKRLPIDLPRWNVIICHSQLHCAADYCCLLMWSCAVGCFMWLYGVTWWLWMFQVAVGCYKLQWEVRSCCRKLSVVVWCCMWMCVVSWWLKMLQVAVGCCKLQWGGTSCSRRFSDVVWCYLLLYVDVCYHLLLSVALCCRLLSSADVVWCYWTPHVAVCCGVMLSVAACGWMLSFAILSHIMLLLVVVCWCILSLGDYRC